MSRPPPAGGDQALARPAPSPLNPTAAHAQDIRVERDSLHRSRARGYHASRRLDFHRINAEALGCLEAICRRLLLNGRREGHEYVALNPRRGDRHLGSFKINLRTGRWADFATDDRGGDPVSLIAFIEDCKQGEAALKLARMLGLDGGGRRHG